MQRPVPLPSLVPEVMVAVEAETRLMPHPLTFSIRASMMVAAVD
jgi:hypothetical protein